FQNFQNNHYIQLEQIRLENDYWLIQQRRDIYQTFTTTVHFERRLRNLPYPSDYRKLSIQNISLSKCEIPIEKIIYDVINLQKKLWKLIPTVENPWDSKFAMLLRSVLSSKRVVEEYRMSLKNWEWLLTIIEKDFIKGLSQPGDMVGTLAA